MSPAAITWDRQAVFDRVRFAPNGCWQWAGRPKPDGYVLLTVRGRSISAHRHVYELLVGPLADDETLDHACHTRDLTCPGGPCPHRSCVNPDHMEPMSGADNTRRGSRTRKTHCPAGHPYSGWNLIRYQGRRYCRACGYARHNARRAAARLAKASS